MYKNVELLNTNEHKNLAIKQVADVAYAQELTSSPITVPEFFEACKDYPIVFAKDASNNSWFATVLLGYLAHIGTLEHCFQNYLNTFC